MSLVEAKCTQCGVNIRVDDTKEAGICSNCGTAFITEKVITNFNVNVTVNNSIAEGSTNVVGEDFQNLLEIDKNSLGAGNGKEALDYANKALEIKAGSYEAWLIKMKSLEFVGTIGDPRALEVISCGKKRDAICRG